MNISKWTELENEAPESVVSSLKKLNDFYDGHGLIRWLANLYDPEVGAFYYSNSARDHEGYAPDLESTLQLLNIVGGNGAFSKYNNSQKDALPPDISAKIVKFTKEMQSDVDGYFYHKQWLGLTLRLDRFGRDLGWAGSIFKMFGETPDYDTPSGIKGKLGPPEGKTDTNEGKSAPSKVSTADYSGPEAFMLWLADFSKTIKADSGRAHELAALAAEIRGNGYTKHVLDFLDKIQDEVFEEQIASGEEPTGLWQRSVNYRAVWGLLKYLSFYNNVSCGRKLRYGKYIVKTCIKVIAMPPDGEYHMNDLWNQWAGISGLLKNLARHDPEALGEIYETVRENATSLIDNSIEKIKPFKHSDGSFAYCVNGHSLAKIYGTPISLGASEGDVNATALAVLMYKDIFNCLGYKVVPLCDAEDGEMFLDIIKNKQPVKKLAVENKN